MEGPAQSADSLDGQLRRNGSLNLVMPVNKPYTSEFSLLRTKFSSPVKLSTLSTLTRPHKAGGIYA